MHVAVISDPVVRHIQPGWRRKVRVRSRDGLPLERRRLLAEEREPRADAAGGVVEDAVLAASHALRRVVPEAFGALVGKARGELIAEGADLGEGHQDAVLAVVAELVLEVQLARHEIGAAVGAAVELCPPAGCALGHHFVVADRGECSANAASLRDVERLVGDATGGFVCFPDLDRAGQIVIETLGRAGARELGIGELLRRALVAHQDGLGQDGRGQDGRSLGDRRWLLHNVAEQGGGLQLLQLAIPQLLQLALVLVVVVVLQLLLLVLVLLVLLVLLRSRHLGLLLVRHSCGHVEARRSARRTDETARQSTLHNCSRRLQLSRALLRLVAVVCIKVVHHVLEVVEGGLRLGCWLELEGLRFDHLARYLCRVERGERGRHRTELDGGDAGGSLVGESMRAGVRLTVGLAI
eukprot:scaffold17336_cov58-Phaeocystis_antarctica.AAC.6